MDFRDTQFDNCRAAVISKSLQYRVPISNNPPSRPLDESQTFSSTAVPHFPLIYVSIISIVDKRIPEISQTVYEDGLS